MKRETLIWSIIMIGGLLILGVRFAMMGGFGKVYVREVPVNFVQVERPEVAEDGTETGESETVWVAGGSPEEAAAGAVRTGSPSVNWTKREAALPKQFNAREPGVIFSLRDTIGTWFAAFLTLSLFSFLYRDNAFYKLAESIFIGVSAAYWMVVGFWSVIVPNVFGSLAPNFVRSWAMPGLEATEPDYMYVVPLILGVMLLWRLAPRGGWISRWPLALFIGVFAGLRMIQFIQADFLNQVRNSVVPFVATEGGRIDFGTSIWNIVSVLGTLACLTYFFFSFEHKGTVGKIARVGTWILMITFGAMFGYTVMGRIALLTGRLEFLFIDWLWLIDPTGTRATASLISTLTG